MKLYGYGRCSTCRKAYAWLREHGIAADPIDITTDPPSLDELRMALEQLGRRSLLNTSGQSYRALGAAAVAAMDDEQLLAALAADGRLIKRPLVIDARQRVLSGFKPQDWQQLLD